MKAKIFRRTRSSAWHVVVGDAKVEHIFKPGEYYEGYTMSCKRVLLAFGGEELAEASSFDDVPKVGRFPRVCSQCTWPFTS
jgi:hypothetical protein